MKNNNNNNNIHICILWGVLENIGETGKKKVFFINLFDVLEKEEKKNICIYF